MKKFSLGELVRVGKWVGKIWFVGNRCYSVKFANFPLPKDYATFPDWKKRWVHAEKGGTVIHYLREESIEPIENGFSWIQEKI